MTLEANFRWALGSEILELLQSVKKCIICKSYLDLVIIGSKIRFCYDFEQA